MITKNSNRIKLPLDKGAGGKSPATLKAVAMGIIMAKPVRS